MRVLFPCLTILGLAMLTGCGSSDFDGGAIKGMLEGSPQELSGEQVLLTDQQVTCGAQNDLWDPPSGNTARVQQKGRNLHFSDDVRLNDPEIPQPYIQIAGSLPVQVADVSRIRDTDGGMKLADVKLGITISHECFPAPLPVMGIRKGKFAADAPVVFRFRGGGKEWALDKLIH
jgi:hypothetical protein